MAITFPFAAGSFAALMRKMSVKFWLADNMESSGLGSGQVIVADLAPKYWSAEVALINMSNADAMQMQALFEALDGGLNDFYLYDPRCEYPQYDLDGSKLSAGSGVVVGGEAAYGDVAAGTYRYEGGTVSQAAAVTITSDAGTYWDADGSLVSAAANVLRFDYGPFDNLFDLRYINDLSNGYWVKNSVAITTDAIAAPDGTMTADLVTLTGASPSFYRVFTVKPSTQYTFSMSVRLGTLPVSEFKMAFRDDTAGTFIAQDVLPAQVPNASGWTRVSYALTTPAGCTSLRVYPFRSTTVSTGTFYEWGNVLNPGAAALAYPRARLGILTEAAQGNLMLRSEEFDNAAWSKSAATITANALAAPDGTTTMDKLVEDTTNAVHLVAQYKTVSGSSGDAYTIAVFAKAAERTAFLLQMDGTGWSANARFNCATGAVDTTSGVGTSASITHVGGGIYLCTLTGIATAAYTAVGHKAFLYNGTSSSYLGDGVSGLYLWGAQQEASGTLHSYVKTTSAAVTRAADVLSLKALGTNDFTITYDNSATGTFANKVGNWSVSAAGLARPWIRRWTAARVTQPGASTVTNSAVRSNGKEMKFTGLPIGYQLRAGDMFSFDYGSGNAYRALHRVVVGGTADLTGSTDWMEFRPFLSDPSLPTGKTMTLIRPTARMKMLPGSFDAGTARQMMTTGMSFKCRQVP